MAFGVTIGQRQGSDSARLTGNHDLRNRSPGVIGYQVELVNPDAVQKFRDKLGKPRQCDVDVIRRNGRVPVTGQIQSDAAPPRSRDGGHDIAPEQTVGEDAVNEYRRCTGTDVEIADAATFDIHAAPVLLESQAHRSPVSRCWTVDLLVRRHSHIPSVARAALVRHSSTASAGPRNRVLAMSISTMWK
ncbi:Uncharacterised protein [Mycobacteroides abscessus subsp. massiliense]|nr:Uncharacterised protein [Mycobacteroides abscessus subsp. massiliense]